MKTTVLAAVITALSIALAGCGGEGSSIDGADMRKGHLSAGTVAAAADPDVVYPVQPELDGSRIELTKLAETRIDRQTYEYRFRATIRGDTLARTNVSATLLAGGVGTTVIAGAITVADLQPLAVLESSSTIVLRHDRRYPFSFDTLKWNVRSDIANSHLPITAQPVDGKTLTVAASGERFVAGELLVILRSWMNRSDLFSFAAKYQAQLIGMVPDGNLIQLRFNAETEGELMAAREKVLADDNVLSALPNAISDAQASVFIPDDKFFAQYQASNLADIDATNAWWRIKNKFKYDGNPLPDSGMPSLAAPKVGVIDLGFSKDIDDLPFVELRGPAGLESNFEPVQKIVWNGLLPTSVRDWHGMHVAGIIGARGNNGLSATGNKSQIAGIAWQSRPQLYGARSDGSDAVDLAHLARLARSGVRIVNLSMGRREPIPEGGSIAYASLYANYLRSLFLYHDFLYVLAAGNSFNEARLHQPLGHLFGSGSLANNDHYKSVRDRVILVANADTSGTNRKLYGTVTGYDGFDQNKLWCPGNGLPPKGCGGTNFGNGIQIAAPGTDILSLQGKNDPSDDDLKTSAYVSTGTSMAAPHVAGVAAALLSINPKLSAAQLKEILVESAKKSKAEVTFATTDIPATHSDLNLTQWKYPLLNMAEAVELALKTTGNPATIDENNHAQIYITLTCAYPATKTYCQDQGCASYVAEETKPILLNTRIATSTKVLFEGWGLWAAMELPAGSYGMSVQDGVFGQPWSSTAKTTKKYFLVKDSDRFLKFEFKYKVANETDCEGVADLIPEFKAIAVSTSSEPSDPKIESTELFDDFNGSAIDATKWNIDGWEGTGNDYTGGLGRGIGPVTINNGLVEFGRLGRISTKNKVTFSGDNTIVIEGRTASTGALHDTSVMLVDTTSGDQILMGETNYAGWGFYAIGIGSYKLKEPGSDPTNPLHLGGITTAFMEYRLTITGDRIKIERGPTLANITQTGSGTLGRSIVGRTFHVSIGAAWAYYPATWDWIRVKTGSPAPVLNPANGRRYEVIECGTWTSCRSAARAKGGELATVRNKAENDWLVANVMWQASTEWGLWIGLTDEVQEGVWRWSSGEPVTFAAWRVGEPNNLWVDGRPEHYVHMWRGSSAPTYLPGVWNDIVDQPIPAIGSASLITQAIVEYLN